MGKLTEGIMQGLREANAHADGKLEVRTTVLAAIPKELSKTDIKNLRLKLGCSQAVLARGLNVSVKTYQSWEQGLRKPSGLALKLFQIVEEHPDIVLT